MTKQTDPKRRISRRETLVLMGGAALAVTVGCGDDSPSETPAGSATATSTPQRTTAATTTASTQTATAAPVSCVVTPEETEGPYFVDEMLNRSDITSDPTDGSVKEGVPLRLTLTVSSVNGATCTPVAGANVDMWHCDADGVYSDVSGGAGQPDTTGQKFLRGYQVSDQNGQVVFQTIFPGWYSGRTPHIHFKVRTNDGLEFTSQLFFDDAIIDAVYAQAPYSENGAADTTNATDNIFSSDLVVSLTEEGEGYAGAFHVGMNAA